MDNSKSPAPAARDRILGAATEEFSEYGYSGARVNRIAEAAGVNKQLIYHYFGSKEGVYAEVLQEMLTNLQSGTDGQGELGGLLRMKSQPNQEAQRAWARMVAWEGLAGESPVVYRAKRQASIDRQIAAIARSQEDGRLSPDLNPRYVLATIYAIATAPYVIPQLIDFCLGADASKSDDTMAVWADFIEQVFNQIPRPPDEAATEN
ncbi:TetR/AcrR family transcriptional regulator [Arthrobacter sp. TMT4-20]